MDAKDPAAWCTPGLTRNTEQVSIRLSQEAPWDTCDRASLANADMRSMPSGKREFKGRGIKYEDRKGSHELPHNDRIAIP